MFDSTICAKFLLILFKETLMGEKKVGGGFGIVLVVFVFIF